MQLPAENISTLSKSVLSGFLAGLMVAFLALVYTIAYREETGFATALIIMPISIFIGFPILLVLGGFSYYLFQKHLPKGSFWFAVFCLAFLIALILFTLQDTRNELGTVFSSPNLRVKGQLQFLHCGKN